MAAVHWLAVHPAAGLPIAELPGLRCGSSLTSLMGSSGGTVNISLPVADRLPENWRQATDPHRVLIVAQFDDPDETVLWAGIPMVRKTGGPTIELTLVDAHGYMDRVSNRFAWHFDRKDAAEIAADIFHSGMLDYYPGTGRTIYGAPHIEFDWPADETAYAAMVRLAEMGVVEWTADWRWES